MAEPQRGPLATAREEAATRGLVLDAQYPSFSPPSTWAVGPPGMLSAAGAAFTATTVNRQYLYPHLVGRAALVSSGAVVQVTTAVAGGTAPLIRVGLYAADPATGYPDTSVVLREGSFTPSATGNITVTWTGGNITLQPGMYWVAVIYTHTAAPTTYPSVACLNNVSWYLPVSTGPSVGVGRALYLTGQTTMKAAATAPSAFPVTGSADCPVAFLKAA